MEYQLNLGIWNQVFAVPAAIVDQHLKLAGAAQLKVLLWFLRHAGEDVGIERIAGALSMHEADVRDSLQYWVQTGVISLREGQLTPAPPQEPSVMPEMSGTDSRSETAQERNAVPQEPIPAPAVPVRPPVKSRALSRPEKPDIKYLGQRIAEDESIAFLMQTADEMYGRTTSNNDKATLLMIHEHDGLPVEVIIMLMQYAFSIGKGNMRYIEKMAINWADEEIMTLDAAERKIKRLTDSHHAAKSVQRILGVDDHSPTEKEKELADLWLNQWKFSEEMVRAAYEACVNIKGKYIPNYVSKILENWHHKGYTSPEQTEKDRAAKTPKKKETYEATYDIAEYESTSVIDEEW